MRVLPSGEVAIWIARFMLSLMGARVAISSLAAAAMPGKANAMARIIVKAILDFISSPWRGFRLKNLLLFELGVSQAGHESPR